MKLPELNKKWKIIHGKMFDRIGSSKFCRKSLLSWLDECTRSESVNDSANCLNCFKLIYLTQVQLKFCF